MMDIARQTYKEVQDDSYEHNNALVSEYFSPVPSDF